MSPLERYQVLLNDQGKIVQLLEHYQKCGIYKMADRYIEAKFKNEQELVKLRKELLMVNK